MRLSFRAKLMTIVATAMIALLVLTTVSAIIADGVGRQLTEIERRYLPKVELGPKLEGQFARLRYAFQDAVAAQDGDALDATRELKQDLLAQLKRMEGAVSARELSELRVAIDEYYASAVNVSQRLIARETGETLVEAMGAMQLKQGRATELIDKLTSFDRGELARTFLAAARAENSGKQIRLLVSLGCLVFLLLLSLLLSRSVLHSLAELQQGFARFGGGDFEQPIRTIGHDEIAEAAGHANRMAQSLKRLSQDRDRNDWLKAGYAGLVDELRGELEPHDVAERALGFLTRYLGVPAAALYQRSDDGVFRRLDRDAPAFALGEGLVGRAAQSPEIVVLEELPADYFRLRSGLGDAAPRRLVLAPLLHLGRVTGVLELACFAAWSPLHSELLLATRETLAIALEVARSRAALRQLLGETQRQARRLEAQEDELRARNEELHAQQEELQQTNLELTTQTKMLEEQRRTLQERNVQLDEARVELEQRAAELTTVSAYKSQFLANMSHELRTPLNSLLLLSSLLADNESGNLTDKQVEFCRTIHGAGKDLLALINQVLDLAKVEAGKQELSIEEVPLARLIDHAQRIFAPLAQERGLAFAATIADGTVTSISSDRQRVEQILNNLLGNAIKFTSAGSVTLRIGTPGPNAQFAREGLGAADCVALEVEDSGIGIAPEHIERVFTPFEQVDAGQGRRYGGTGLGLTIARELAALLGGELQLESTLGRGSTFRCYLPTRGPSSAGTSKRAPAPRSQPPAAMPNAAPAAHEPLAARNDCLLVIEDDPVFSEVLREIIEAQGFVCLSARDGASGLRLAKERGPGGIILDVRLADIDGWTVMAALHADAKTARIPVHFVSALEAKERGMAMGAVGYLQKPATRSQLVSVVEALARRVGDRACRILIVEDDSDDAASMLRHIQQHGLDARRVESAREALDLLARERFNCMVLDLGLPDMDGLELLQALRDRKDNDAPPVVVYTGRALSKAETQQLEAYTEAVVLKGASAAERLVDELRLFAQRLREGQPVRARVRGSSRPPPAPVQLSGKQILVVDDDMRTVYAVSALLRSKGAEVLVADTGVAALHVLAEHPDVHVVLMDIMMPEMDGYEAMRRIRQQPRFQTLPLIALTAKAMKDDRETCLAAGASDYMSKPIDPDRLLALLQRHLHEELADAE